MLPLFETPWDKLDRKAVEAFVKTAREEGVTWEAKADDEKGRLHPDSLRKAVGGLANRIGGYVLVGAKWNKADYARSGRGRPAVIAGISHGV
jgi:hypothetical protein